MEMSNTVLCFSVDFPLLQLLSGGDIMVGGPHAYYPLDSVVAII